MSLLRARRALAFAAVVLAGALAIAVTAANTVPATYAAAYAQGVDPNALAPNECGGIALTTVAGSNGDLSGSPANDLLLGASTDQMLLGDDGDDCLVGGAGADTIEGGAGTDVCIGSVLAVFMGCETFFVY